MTDRLLTTEFAPLFVANSDTVAGGYEFQTVTDYRKLPGVNDQYFVSEHKLDLSGYVMDDLTVYFRNSFEQTSDATTLRWTVDSGQLGGFSATYLEATVLSTVPMSDDNLIAMIFSSPGFIPGIPGVDYGNFDRTHVIHGTKITWGIDFTIGSNSLAANGSGFGRVVSSSDFSSLEPTAADCIYCYRVIYLPEAYDRISYPAGFSSVYVPAKRVLLNSMTAAEPDLEYMMRLKRSYELANQV